MTNKLNALKSVVDEFDRRMKELKTNMMKEFEGTIKGVFMEVFEIHPEIERISWCQFTPYFNDGDPCVFDIHDIHFLTKDDPKDMKDEHLYDWHYDIKRFPALKSLNNLLHSSEEMLLMLFGDHCQITVTRDGIDVEEFEHD